MSVYSLSKSNECVEDEDLSDDSPYLTQAEKEVYAKEDVSLIYFMVNKFRNTKIESDELTSVAAMGFTKALNTFDKRQQVKFSTYAVRCMRNELLHLLRKERNTKSRDISIETILIKDRYENEITIGDLLCVENSGREDMDYKIELDFDSERLLDALEELNKNERFIIESRFGLSGQSIKTQREIAEEIHTSQAYVSKVEKRALSKIRRELFYRFGMTGEEYKTKIENTSTLMEAGYYVNKFTIKFRRKLKEYSK